MSNDNTPTSLFDQYDQDFQHILGSLKEKLDKAKAQIGEQRKATLRHVELELDEGDDMLSQLELELQGIPQSIKSPYAARLKQSRATLTSYKKLSKELHNSANRADLLSNSSSGQFRAVAEEDDHRTRLLRGNQQLKDGQRRLMDSTSVALDTEAQGAEILNNLRGQRDQLENARDMLHTADSNIDRAGTTVKTMIRQMYKQRFIFIALGLVMIIVIVLVLFFKLRR